MSTAVALVCRVVRRRVERGLIRGFEGLSPFDGGTADGDR